MNPDRDLHTGNGMPVMPVPPPGGGSAAPPLALRYQLHVLRRRWWLIALVALTVMGGAWWRSRAQIPMYTAQMQLQKQPDRDLLEAGWAGFYDLTPEAINAQIQIIQGEGVLDPVVDSVSARLVFVDPAVVRSRVFESVIVSPSAPEGTYTLKAVGANDVQLVDTRNRELARAARGEPMILNAMLLRTSAAYSFGEPVVFRIVSHGEALGVIGSGLRIEQMKGTMILAIRYTSPDPEFSRDVTNAVGMSYAWYTGKRARSDASNRKNALKERLVALEDSLLLAQRLLRPVTDLPITSGAAANPEAVSAELLRLTSEVRGLRFKRAQLADVRNTLLRNRDDGVQRAVSFGDALPGAREQYNQLLELQNLRLETMRARNLQSNAPEIVRVDSAIADVGHDILKLVTAQLEQTEALVANEEARLKELQADFGIISNRMAETDALRQQTDAIQRVYFDLSEKYYEAQINERLESGAVDIIMTAKVPAGPDGSRKTRSFFFAMVIGVILGVLAAFVLEQMDTRVRDAEDAQRAAAVGVIGMIPELRGDASRPLTLKADDHTLGAEAYRKLRTNLRFLRADRPRVIAVTSPSPDEGKSVTAANLALAMAQQGQEVLIVDGDLRRPVQHEIFGVPRGAGLSDALVGLVDPFDVIIPYEQLQNISVMTCGTEAPNPAELLGSEAFSRLLNTLLERFDTIVVDTPPVNLVTDAAVIGSVTDGVLLVAEAGRTDRAVLAAAVNELRQARGSVLGIVLNRVAPGGGYSRYGGYYSGKLYYKKTEQAVNAANGGNGDRVTAIKDWISALI